MKKLLLFAVILASGLAANAQNVIFEESFDNGIPHTWISLDQDEDGYGWTDAVTLLNEWDALEALEDFAVGGTGNAAVSISYTFTDDDYYALTPDNWLISPAIVIPSSGACELSWYSSVSFEEDFVSVYVATSDDVSAFLATAPVAAYSYDENQDYGPVLHTASLAAFAGQTVYLAFRHHNSEDGYVVSIDNVTISAVSTPLDIELTQLNIPSTVTAGGSFSVSGTVKNNGAVAINSYDVQYTFDGTPSETYTVSNVNLLYGESRDFTHPVTVPSVSEGQHTVVVTISNPNRESDNLANNTLTARISGCSAISSIPYSEDFDYGFGCWNAIDGDDDGQNWMMASEYFDDPTEVAYDGSADCAMSLSYDDMVGYAYEPDNWLVSPAIVLPSETMVSASWFASSAYDEFREYYSVYVATNNDINSFLATEPIFEGYPTGEFQSHTVSLADYAGQTVYIAFRHWNCEDQYYLLLDQFSLNPISSEPEIVLASITAPTHVALNTPFSVGCNVTNNSSTPLTQFSVTYEIDGESATQQVSGINVGCLQSYQFDVNSPALATIGSKNITITVSSPNGVADNEADNSQSSTVYIYDASTLPSRTVLMETFVSPEESSCAGINTMMDAAMANYDDQVVRVNHFLGDYEDYLTQDFEYEIAGLYNDYDFFLPGVMLDRTYWAGSAFTSGEQGPVFHPISSNNMSNALATATAEPAFVTVTIDDLSYDNTTKILNATVKGNVLVDLVSNDVRLNVWLLEDSLLADGSYGVGHGPMQVGASGTFYHNCVLRANLASDPWEAWGDGGIVSPVAGSTFTQHYTTSITPNFDPTKCYLVAFVGENLLNNNLLGCRVYNSTKSAYIYEGSQTPDPGPGPGPGPDPEPQGIGDVSANNVKLYPNPTTGNLYIEVEGLQKVDVIDAVGRVVMSRNDGNVVNMSNLANGIYTVRVMANGNTAVKKVVKK
ncbi:MAG: choice-of-anchor J domain-containing protein [Bacteroidales bacterium]|nr:choice-of-anchor J domain-containing protein [Bacteroidales bacterium]